MDSGNTDVSNLHICIDTSPNLELVALIKEKDMNDFGRCTFDALHYEIVIIRLLEVHDLEELALHLILKWCLAQLALKGLPEEAADKVSIVY